MLDLIQEAQNLGFDTAVTFNPAILEARQDIREMCNADKCMTFGKNWGCPPYCGTVEECQKKMHSYSNGILLQTTGHMTKAIDSKCYRDTERRHLTAFYALPDLQEMCVAGALPFPREENVQHGGLWPFCYSGLPGCWCSLLLWRTDDYVFCLHPLLKYKRHSLSAGTLKNKDTVRKDGVLVLVLEETQA